MSSNSVVQSYEINATLNHTSPKNARNPKISVAILTNAPKRFRDSSKPHFVLIGEHLAATIFSFQCIGEHLFLR